MANEWPHEFPGTNWIDEQEENAVRDVARKGSFFRYYGPEQPTHAEKLEALARRFYGSKYALAVSGGTGGLITSMIALGVGPGDEVIIPAFMWVSTVGAAVHCNAVPVLCEVDKSFDMDPEDLAKKITSRTKLIVVVHMAGTPCNMEKIMKIADERGIDVLEDCAQCNGGAFQGKKVGTFGRIGMFSFQINKNVTAGEGGILVTDDEDLYWLLNAAHDVGVPWKDGAPQADHTACTWGQGRRMSELCGAVANIQLTKLPSIVDFMRESNHRIQTALSDLPGIEFRHLNDPAGDTGPFLVVMMSDENTAKKAAEKIKSAGWESVWQVADYGMHIYYNIPQLVNRVPLSPAGNPWSLAENRELVREYGKGACPKSDELFSRSVIVAIPSRLSEEQEGRMIEILRNAL